VIRVVSDATDPLENDGGAPGGSDIRFEAVRCGSAFQLVQPGVDLLGGDALAGFGMWNGTETGFAVGVVLGVPVLDALTADAEVTGELAAVEVGVAEVLCGVQAAFLELGLGWAGWGAWHRLSWTRDNPDMPTSVTALLMITTLLVSVTNDPLTGDFFSHRVNSSFVSGFCGLQEANNQPLASTRGVDQFKHSSTEITAPASNCVAGGWCIAVLAARLADLRAFRVLPAGAGGLVVPYQRRPAF
jgi:hypothetical protein